MTPQQVLIDRVRADFEELEVVRGLWLTGSFGSRTEDEWSDVDMFALVDDDKRDGLVGSWPQFAARYGPLMLKQTPGTPVYGHILSGWLRWDLVIGTLHDLAFLDKRRVVELVNKDGAAAGSPGHRGADLDVVLEMTEEFLRVLGLLPVVLARDEMVTAVSGTGLLRQLLTTLMRYRVEGDRLSGALHLSKVLPEDQLQALLALPVAHPDPGSVTEAHLACARMFLPVARQMLADRFPVQLEEACFLHLEEHLGADAVGAGW